MSIHVHRNSFNAGEISPLMDARVDDAKHAFSCRRLENFIPRIYGGAFRRPGTIYTATCPDVAVWTEQTQFHAPNLLFDGEDVTPGTGDDSGDGFEVGSLWLKNVRSVYKCTTSTTGAAVWALQNTYQNNLYALEAPTVDDDTTEGYAVGSIWMNWNTKAVWLCSDATDGAAVWGRVTYKLNTGATAVPGANDDAADGYAVGSMWVRNVRTIYQCTDATATAAVWAAIVPTSNAWSDTEPTGANDGEEGYSVGSVWIGNNGLNAWKLTSLSGSAEVRLFAFNVSATVRYVLEMGDGYVRIWDADSATLVEDPSASGSPPVRLATPYRSTEIFEVQIAQLGNLAYFAHPNHPPQKLERYYDASYAAAFFRWEEVDWSFPCFRDTNTTEVTATPSSTTGLAQTISFTDNPFTETVDYSRYTGARILLSQRRSAAHVKLALTSTANSSSVSVLGEYSVYTYGTFTGTLRVQGKDESGAWVTLKSFEFSGETDGRNIVFNSATTKATDLRLSCTYTSGSGSVAYLEASDSRRVGYANIIAGITFSNSLPVVDVDIELDFDSTDATTEWAIEAWGEYAGYPRAVCFHEQRLWFGGTELQPNTFWGSALNDFENFRRGALDTDSIAFTLAAEEGSAIQSILSHDALVLFTQSEEWTATTSEQTAITPSNIFVRRQSRFGSAHRQAFVAANNILFLQRGGRKLRQFNYQAGGASGQATDLTVLAEHITQSGINQIAFQAQPDPIIWSVTNDGDLLSLTYESDQNVIAWAKHTTTGDFESIAVTYGDDNETDELWIVVLREGVRMIERMDSEAFTKLESGDQENMIYVDSAVVTTGSAMTTVAGHDHLEGLEVAILADGAVEPNQTVSSGDVTLEQSASTVIVGLPFTSILQPSKIEVPMPDGTSQGRKFVCKRASVNLWKTLGMEYADTPDEEEVHWYAMQGRDYETDLGEAEALFTGIADLINRGAHGRSVDLALRQRLPLPANVLAIVPKFEIHGT